MSRELSSFVPEGEVEERDWEELSALVAAVGDPWSRSLPLHLTGSALVVDQKGGRALLRWHDRQQRFLQVGGHGDPGETSALAVALREAREETGLKDLSVVVPRLVQVVIVDVRAGKGEAAHRHGDLRYVLATGSPDAIVAESEVAVLRWLGLEEALAVVEGDSMAVLIERARRLV